MTVPTLKLQSGKSVRLGRIRPRAVQEVGRMKAIIAPSGKVHFVPRLSHVYDEAADRDPPPESIDWSPKAAAALSRMYLNDQEGDCVIAGKYHKLGTWTGNESGTPIVATDDEVQQSYQTICGPGDNGCNIADVMDYWKTTGLVAGEKRYKIDGFVSVDQTNSKLLKVAIQLFGGLTLGVNLTSDCTNSGPGVVWNFRGQIVGGHDVFAYGYNAQGVLISTWGSVGTLIPWAVMTKRVTQEAGVEEVYTALSPDWYKNQNLAPNGINAQQLRDDLAQIGGGNVPPNPPNPPPPTPPGPSMVCDLLALGYHQVQAQLAGRPLLLAAAGWVYNLVAGQLGCAGCCAERRKLSADEASSLQQQFDEAMDAAIAQAGAATLTGLFLTAIRAYVDQLFSPPPPPPPPPLPPPVGP